MASRSEIESIVREYLERNPPEVGRITADKIPPRSIKPRHCDLSAAWQFTAGITAPNITEQPEGGLAIEMIYEDSAISVADVILVNAAKRDIEVMLGAASAASKSITYIKRIDTNPAYTVTIQAATDEIIDDSSSMTLSILESAILVTNGLVWYKIG